MPLTAVGKIDLDAVPRDLGHARLLLEACTSVKPWLRAAGLGLGPGQPPQRLLNNLIRGGLASSLLLPIGCYLLRPCFAVRLAEQFWIQG